MKAQVGVEEFSRVYAAATTAKAARKHERKRKLAVEVSKTVMDVLHLGFYM